MSPRHLRQLGHDPERFVRSYLALEHDSETRREQAEIAAALRAESDREVAAIRKAVLLITAVGMVAAALLSRMAAAN